VAVDKAYQPEQNAGMSTLHSTPSNAGVRSHPVGFNEQTYYDPFFPSSANEEQLVPMASDPSPSHRSSPSPSHILKSNDGPQQLNSSQNGHIQEQRHTTHILANAYNTPTSPRSHPGRDNSNAAYGFLSPNHYMSDNGYNASSEHTATPEYDGFYLEDNYGMLDNPAQGTLHDPATFQNSHLSQTSADIDSPRLSDYNHRASIGAATLSSHLMSPVLTDAPDPASRHGTASPPDGMEHIKKEARAGAPAVRINTVQPNGMHQFGLHMQETPTTTASYKGDSPEMPNAAANLVRGASPVIRVDKYSGGDSPILDRGGWNGGKRVRPGSSSSHLAVNNDHASTDDDDEEHDHFEERVGMDPASRFQVSNVDLLNFKEQEDNAQRALKNADVQDWLERGDSSEGTADMAPEKPKEPGKRRRAKSAGAQSLSHANLESLRKTGPDSHIPGPGVLIDEESGEDSDMEDDDEIASIDESPPPTTALGGEINEVPGEAKPGVYDELDAQPSLYRAKVWQDPLYDSTDPGIRMQPITSSDAIRKFETRVEDLETLSRSATWGTRRMSESDLEGLFHRLTFSNDKITEPAKRKRERSASFIREAAAKLVPRRSFTLKRRESEKAKRQAAASRPTLAEHARNSSGESRSENLMVPSPASKGLQRMSSLGKRPKSPRINTGSAVAAMASQMAALGPASVSTTACSSPTGAWTITKNILKRSRSRSDVNSLPSPGYSSTTEQGIQEMWAKQPGPPMPTLVTPRSEAPSQYGDYDDDDDDGVDDVGVTMDLSIKPDQIVPTLEGFKANIRQLNPRLPPFMFDRIAQEQLRRFKKLMDFKIKHVQAVNMGKCQSGKHCTELGGEPTYLPSKSSNREAEISHTGFSVSGLGPSDDDVNALAEGIVTPAQFPPGVPMPPVKRLPAEFECSLCFKVKKFHKPSDWSKHVHEDVQPFTCTFATCAEPKSFKRKADWVRHENERHRQLEWWMCNMNDCSHKCYRKDNFVQHLVREHKLPEPKVKTTKAGKPAVRGPSSQKARSSRHSDNPDDSNDEIDQVWKLVEECRHETPKNPKDEACKFCGNVCNSWKKLTVHLAKHMEQVSMPVLGVVKQKDVTPETTISPIEHRIASQQASMSPTIAHSPFSQGAPLSPYGMPISTRGEIPGGFTTLQSQQGYFPGTPESQMSYQHQRVSSNTYPPTHAQQLAAGYAQHRGSPYPVSEYGSYSGATTPSFQPVNARGFPNTSPSSPEVDYASLRAPTSQPRSTRYDDGGGYSYVTQPPQNFVASPIEGSVYNFGPSTPTSYPQQASPPTSYPQPGSMGTPSPTFGPQQSQMAMQYGVNPMGEYQQSNDHTTLYSQQAPDTFAYPQ